MNNFAEITINYKPITPLINQPQITSSREAFQILKQYWSERINYKEEFYILLLNKNNIVVGFTKICEGGISSSLVDVRLIFQAALKCNASCIILSHNHPSGNLTPSQSDFSITKRIIEAGNLFEISIFDHIIMSEESFYSFADNSEM